jgi:hypothetical protein
MFCFNGFQQGTPLLVIIIIINLTPELSIVVGSRQPLELTGRWQPRACIAVYFLVAESAPK